MILTNFLTSLQNMGVKLFYLLLALAILLLMVMIHELGHYVFGKIFKFKINEFSIGFGKAIFSHTKKNGEKISLRMIPLGGYCAFEGEDEAKNVKPEAFNNQKPWKRLIVLAGGVVFNFISAIFFVVFLISIVGTGVPKIVSVTGENANFLLAGDEIVKINGEKPSFINGGLNFILSDWDKEDPILLVIKRENEDGKAEYIDQEIYLQPFIDSLGETYYAIGITEYNYQKYNAGEAILYSVPYTFEMAGDCLELLGKLVTGKLSIANIGGPVTTISTIAEASQVSYLNLLLLFPLLAVNLAVFNALPIPALDGARMVFVLIEWIRKKPINRDLEAKIHFWGLVVLFAFVILVDILHFTVFS